MLFTERRTVLIRGTTKAQRARGGGQGVNDSDPREEKSGISGEQENLNQEASDVSQMDEKAG